MILTNQSNLILYWHMNEINEILESLDLESLDLESLEDDENLTGTTWYKSLKETCPEAADPFSGAIYLSDGLWVMPDGSTFDDRDDMDATKDNYRLPLIDIEDRRKSGAYKHDYDRYTTEESKDLDRNKKTQRWNDFLDLIESNRIVYTVSLGSHVYVKTKRGQTAMIYPKSQKITFKGGKGPRKFFKYRDTEKMLKKYSII